MKTSALKLFTIMLFGTVAAMPAMAGLAQEATKATADSKPAAATKPHDVYRLAIVVRELEGDRVINSRNFTMSAEDGDWSKLRVGSRVIVPSGNSYIYKDVGVNFDCRVEAQGSDLLLTTKFEGTSLAPPDQVYLFNKRRYEPSAASAAQQQTAVPATRQVSLAEESLVTPGKPTIIGKLDDVVTSHRFEIEVTATKMK